MRKSKSRLHKYLRTHGGDNPSPSELRLLKRRYRKQYQRHWQKKNRAKRNEIRFSVTRDDYQKIKGYCTSITTNPTAFARELLLAQIGNHDPIVNKDALLEVLQALGQGINQLDAGDKPSSAKTKLLKAETLLLNYLNYVSCP